MASKKTIILKELSDHLPFSIFFTAAGMAVAGLLLYVAVVAGPVRTPAPRHEQPPVTATAHDENSREQHAEGHDHLAMPRNANVTAASSMIFHLFHPIHLLLSALATTAMFWSHERKLLKAVIIGFIGAAGVCGVSDIFMPFLAGKLLGVDNMHLHWCLIEHTQMVLPFIGLGIVCGLLAPGRISQATQFSHSSHIFVSVIASLFYLLSFGVNNWMDENVFPYVFIIVLLCVTIPCCISDIIFPLLSVSCQGTKCATGAHTH